MIGEWFTCSLEVIDDVIEKTIEELIKGEVNGVIEKYNSRL